MKNLTFEFRSYEYRPQDQNVYFHYELHGDMNRSYVETLTLPPHAREIPSKQLTEILFSLHLILGISYWKAHVPTSIVIKSGTLTKAQADYWNVVYTKGLGEFFYKNSIDFTDIIQFPFEEIQKESESFSFSDRALVGVGGGKDSLVSVELLKKSQKDITGMVIETQKEYNLLKEIIQSADIPVLKVQRTLDPQLFQKNEGTYDGHIPISAVYAWIGVLLSVLYDYRSIIVSNEHSSNYGNVEYHGQMINHQWSKSIEFEQMMQRYIQDFITPEIQYFSLLRSLTEMKIVELFIRYPRYFHLFSSCNRNFSISLSRQIQTKWCGECPKCAFVFILLASYLTKDDVIGIFGKNLLADEHLKTTYEELLGIRGFKPFECVGTPEETQYAFLQIVQKHEYSDDVILQMFQKEFAEKLDHEQLKKLVMRTDMPNSIPQSYQSIQFS